MVAVVAISIEIWPRELRISKFCPATPAVRRQPLLIDTPAGTVACVNAKVRQP